MVVVAGSMGAMAVAGRQEMSEVINAKEEGVAQNNQEGSNTETEKGLPMGGPFDLSPSSPQRQALLQLAGDGLTSHIAMSNQPVLAGFVAGAVHGAADCRGTPL